MLGPGVVVAAKYRLRRAIDREGAGAIFEAERLTDGTAVALKLYEIDGSDRAELPARLADAQLVAALRHPNLVDVLELGADGDHLYVVTSILEGQSLRDRLDHGAPVTFGAAIDIVCEALRGLDAIHYADSSHRKLKPRNLFLADECGHTVTKLLDLGLGRMSSSGLVASLARLDPDSLAYVSPEQAAGGRADERSDIYALGVLMYEVLAGKTPFARNTEAETLLAIMSEEAVPLSELVPDCAPALSAIVSRALSRDPRDRFESPKDMRSALEDVRLAHPELDEVYVGIAGGRVDRLSAPDSSVSGLRGEDSESSHASSSEELRLELVSEDEAGDSVQPRRRGAVPTPTAPVPADDAFPLVMKARLEGDDVDTDEWLDPPRRSFRFYLGLAAALLLAGVGGYVLSRQDSPLSTLLGPKRPEGVASSPSMDSPADELDDAREPSMAERVARGDTSSRALDVAPGEAGAEGLVEHVGSSPEAEASPELTGEKASLETGATLPTGPEGEEPSDTAATRRAVQRRNTRRRNRASRTKGGMFRDPGF